MTLISKKATIQVTLPKRDRLKAITKLSSAIEMLAKALAQPTASFLITNNIITSTDKPGINVDVEQDTTETYIIKEEEDENTETDGE
jgi:hypothetical protein